MSDAMKIIATPLPTLLAEKKLEATAEKVAKELTATAEKGGYTISEIVVGMPLRMDGQMGLMADEVNLFIEALSRYLDIPIVRWDERLTSMQAERSMREGQMNRKQRAKVVDQVAAVIILQSYLDSRSL